jgi:hypothetical protein
MTRPPHREPPVGFRYTPMAAPGWRVESGRQCRARLPGSTHTVCKAPAVAALNRGWHHAGIGGRVASWWAYCPEHLAGYGKWIEHDTVLCWKLEET